MAKPRRPKKPDATGRNDTSRFARLDHRLLTSNAYRALSPNSRSLLVELVMLDKGDNNGSLWLSVRDGADRMGVADLSAASKAFAELQELGFIQMTQDSAFHVKASETSRARCWRLTWLAGPGRKGPSSEYLEREPAPQTKARKRMERGCKALKRYRAALSQNKLPVLDSNTLAQFEAKNIPKPVLEATTGESENRAFPPMPVVLDSATHTAVTMGNSAHCVPMGWWQPDWTTLIASAAFADHLLRAIRVDPNSMAKAA